MLTEQRQTLLAARNRSTAYAKKSAILVGELLGLSTRVLPLKYGTQWQVCRKSRVRGLLS
jgi:hypothetical protein